MFNLFTAIGVKDQDIDKFKITEDEIINISSNFKEEDIKRLSESSDTEKEQLRDDVFRFIVTDRVRKPIHSIIQNLFEISKDYEDDEFYINMVAGMLIEPIDFLVIPGLLESFKQSFVDIVTNDTSKELPEFIQTIIDDIESTIPIITDIDCIIEELSSSKVELIDYINTLRKFFNHSTQEQVVVAIKTAQIVNGSIRDAHYLAYTTIECSKLEYAKPFVSRLAKLVLENCSVCKTKDQCEIIDKIVKLNN